MADKFSVLIKYKYLEYIENAKLSDADAWAFMKGLIEYDKTGREPKFKKQILAGLFAVLKCDLDENRGKWEERVTANSKNGKKGGRPKKTDNNPNNPEEPEKPNGFSETHWGPENPQKPDSGGDIDSGYEFGGGGGVSNGPEKSNPAKPPPPVLQIKNESGAQGFFIDTAAAETFQNCGIDPAWLSAPHSFLEFTAARIRGKYPERDDDSLKPIYISAVKSWDDFREAYPPWRAERERKAQTAARKAAVEKARANVPRKCQCGGELDGRLVCASCGGFYLFGDENLKYNFSPGVSKSLSEEFAKTIKNGKGA